MFRRILVGTIGGRPQIIPLLQVIADGISGGGGLESEVEAQIQTSAADLHVSEQLDRFTRIPQPLETTVLASGRPLPPGESCRIDLAVGWVNPSPHDARIELERQGYNRGLGDGPNVLQH